MDDSLVLDIGGEIGALVIRGGEVTEYRWLGER